MSAKTSYGNLDKNKETLPISPEDLQNFQGVILKGFKKIKVEGIEVEQPFTNSGGILSLSHDAFEAAKEEGGLLESQGVERYEILHDSNKSKSEDDKSKKSGKKQSEDKSKSEDDDKSDKEPGPDA